MALYTLAEFASYLQEPVDTASATLLLALVTGVISEAAGDTFDPDDAPVTVKTIALNVAARAYVNPQGYTSVTIDDYTSRRENAAQSGVYLTDDEMSAITGQYGAPAGAFTIRGYYEPPTSPIESWA